MSAKNQTVLTPGQMKDLAGAIVEGIPANMSFERAQYWIGKKSQLAKEIKKILLR
jgi:hypothetical protein